jgi:hypothetical protein
MDIDAGVILNGVPIADVGSRYSRNLSRWQVAKNPKASNRGLGEDEFAPGSSARSCRLGVGRWVWCSVSVLSNIP